MSNTELKGIAPAAMKSNESPVHIPRFAEENNKMQFAIGSFDCDGSETNENSKRKMCHVNRYAIGWVRMKIEPFHANESERLHCHLRLAIQANAVMHPPPFGHAIVSDEIQGKKRRFNEIIWNSIFSHLFNSMFPIFVVSACLASYGTETVMQLCHGRRRCTISADRTNFGNPCRPESRVYLKVVYTCSKYPQSYTCFDAVSCHWNGPDWCAR